MILAISKKKNIVLLQVKANINGSFGTCVTFTSLESLGDKLTKTENHEFKFKSKTESS